MNEENLKKLYESLSQDYDLGEFDAFKSGMEDPEKRKKAFDAASQKFDVGDFDAFETNIGFGKKKDDTALSSQEDFTDGELGLGWTREAVEEIDPNYHDEKIPSAVLKRYHSQTIENAENTNWNWYDHLNPWGPKHEAERKADMAEWDIALAEKRENTEKELAAPVESVESIVRRKLSADQSDAGSILSNVALTTNNMFTAMGATLGDALMGFDQFVSDLAPSGPSEERERLEKIRSVTLRKMGKRLDANGNEMLANHVVRNWDQSLSYEENLSVAQQGIIETFNKDGAADGFAEIGAKTAESVPYLVLGYLTGGVGPAATGGAFFSTGYGDSLLEQYNTDPENVDRGRATTHGIIEGVTSIAFGGISKVGKQAFKSIGKEEAKRIVSLNARNQTRQILAGAGKTGLGEGMEEAMQESLHYIVDQAYEGEEIDWERVATMAGDSFILGAFAGTPSGATGRYGAYIRAKGMVNPEVAAIGEELKTQSTKDNPKKAKYLNERRQEAFKNLGVDPSTMDDATKKEIDDIYFEIKSKEGIIAGMSDKSMRDGLIDETNALKEQLNGIITRIDEGARTDAESKGPDAEAESEVAIPDQQDGSRDADSELREEGTGQQNSEFFTGKAKAPSSSVKYEPTLEIPDTPFNKSYKKHTEKGNFTGHIFKMIPGFAEKQSRVGEAIVKTGKKSFLDIGASEGGLAKAIGESNPDAKITVVDPNPTMKKNFDESTDAPGNVTYELAALGSSWVEKDGTVIPEFKSEEKYDVVNEDFVFQFISPNRDGQVKAAKSHLKEGGVFITSEKFHTANKEENEAKKYDHQKKYFSEDQLTEDKQTIVSGMSDSMVSDASYAETLTNNFEFVYEFWNAGNFKGYLASDSKLNLEQMIEEIGPLDSEFVDAKSLTAGRALTKDNFKAESKSVPKSQDEINAKFRESFTKITEGKTEEAHNLMESGIKASGKRVNKAEKIAFDNKVMKTAGLAAGKVRKFVNDYLDTPASFVTKGVVKGAKKSGEYVGRKSSQAENAAIREIEKITGKEIKNYITANGLIREAINSFVPNVNLDEGQQQVKGGFTGEKNLGKEMTGKLIIGLQSHPAYNPESMERIHMIMDPEASQNVVGPNELITNDQLTDPEKEMLQYLRGINDYIHETNYANGLIDEKTYDKFKGKYIARLYEEIEMVEAKSDFDSGAIDATIYAERKELHDQMTSVRDPLYLTMTRFGQTMQNVAVSDYIKSIAADKKNHMTPEQWEQLEQTDKSKYAKLSTDSKGKRFGELEGQYVLKTYVEDLKNQQFLSKHMNNLHKGLSWYDRSLLRQMTKQGLTVFNPATRLVNIISGFHFASMAGVDGLSFARNRVTAKEDFSKGLTEDIEFLFKKGILSTSNIDNELSISKADDQTGADEDTGAEGLEPLSQEVQEQTFLNGMLRVGRAAKDNYKSISKMARKSYGRSDDIAKLSTFKSLLEQGFSREEAALKTAKSMQNYSSVGKAFSLGAKVPMVGNAFVRFQADLMRITSNALIDKPVTTSMFIGSIMALGRLTSYLSGESDEERIIRSERPFTPGLDLPGINIPLVWKIGNQEVNMAKFMTPYYTYDLGSKEDDTFSTKFLPFDIVFKDNKMHLRSGDPTLGWALDLARDRDFRDKSITNPTGNSIDQRNARMNQFIYAMRNSIGNAVPVKLVHDMMLYNKDGQDYYGRNRDISTTLMSRVIKIEKWEDSKYKEKVIDFFYYKDKEIDKLTSERNKFERDLERKVLEIQRLNISEPEKNKRIKSATDEFIRIVMDSYDEEIKLNSEKVDFADKIPVMYDEIYGDDN